jgi:hypothetical protein
MGTNELNIPGRVSNSDHVVYSSFYGDNSVTQNSFLVHPKNIIIDLLRREFSVDSLYTYRSDEYGFPLVKDLTGLDPGSELTTNVLIGEMYRYDLKFFPNILVSSKGGQYKPLSANQNQTTKYRRDVFVDQYGNENVISTPTHKVYAGMWDHSLEIQINSESHIETEEISEIVALMLQYKLFHELRAAGVVIKTLSVSAESSEKYINDNIFTQSISISCISEWRVEVPINNIVEKIVMNIASEKTPIDNSSTTSQKFSDIVSISEYYDFSDSDLDGIYDSGESFYGTSAYNKDSDLDGFYDGDEVSKGTDPSDPQSFPS